MQDRVFCEGEGNAYHSRNRDISFHGRVRQDIIIRILQEYHVPLWRQRVLEVGCGLPYRLQYLSALYHADAYGIDASSDAIKEGQQLWPGLHLRCGPATYLRGNGPFPLVIISFLLHWIDRVNLLSVVAEVDRVLLPGGYLVLADFAPDHPCAVPYKHRDGLYTYKMPYHQLFTATCGYRLAAYLEWDHDSHELSANVPGERRAFCALLRKEGQA